MDWMRWKPIIQRMILIKRNCALRLARENELLFSGGSDYHGKNKPLIRLGVGKGNLKIPMEYCTMFVECV